MQTTANAPTVMNPAANPATNPAMNPNDWCWLQPGVDAASVLAMFEAVYLMAMTLAWYTLSGKEAARACFTSCNRILYLRLETRYVRPGRLRIMLHIARDEETLAAWREGLVGASQITITAVPRSELPTAGIVEWCRLGREPYDELPMVTVGLERRRPSAAEWHIAARAIEAFDLLHDCFCESRDGLQRRQLASGEQVFIETLEPEFDAFPENDGGVAS